LFTELSNNNGGWDSIPLILTMKHISKRERKHTVKKTTHLVAHSELLANGKIWIRMERPRHQQMATKPGALRKDNDLITE